MCRADFLHIFHCDCIFLQCITKQLFQFSLEILHIIPGLCEKKLYGSLGNLLPFPFHHPKDPSNQCMFVLSSQFHDTPFCFHCLIKLSALVNFLFYKQKVGCLRKFFQIICQLRGGIFEKSRIFHNDQTTLTKKRHCLCQIDQLFRMDSFPFIIRVIHRISFIDNRF